MKFYFTYGTSETQPFIGGWTEVQAPDRQAAYAVFRAYHTDKTSGILNCSDIYMEDDFRKTEMYKSGNFGFRCHETIELIRHIT